MKEELKKILQEYRDVLTKENRLIAETEYKFRHNMARKEMSLDSFINWLETGEIL